MENKKKNKKEGIRLNKYLANAGIAARRKADVLISQGNVKVNGKVVLEMGYKVQSGDKVTFKGKAIKPQGNIYVLLNKPKDYISTLSDEKGRKTVTDLIRLPGRERIYPVGRLDRNTTGLLLLTNDGELAQALSHPSKNVKKLYVVGLDKPVSAEHLSEIENGIELEDGSVKPDEISNVRSGLKKEIGLLLHSGRNRVVRRIFEHFGYCVKKLDRVMYAGLTKKDLTRGKWRYLTPREIIRLKHFLQ